MSKQIQAYFQTESEAEGAKSSLLGYKTQNLEVSKLETAIGRDTNLLSPLVAVNSSDNVTALGTSGMSSAGGIAGTSGVPIIMENDARPNVDDNRDVINTNNSDHYEGLNYVLVAKVEDEHYEEIIQKLRNNNAHVEALS
ncbi:hypothetical protein [Paenibacillus sp. CMAA1364]